MGAIGDFLSHAAGDVSKGVNAATNAAGIISNAGSSVPSVPSAPPGAPTGMTDFNSVPISTSNIGSPSMPTSGGLSLTDLVGQNPQAAANMFTNMNPGVNNPYDPLYSQSTPQAQAASIGTPDQSQAPINVTGDGWKPPFEESTLAKVGDFFFHNMFRNRTSAANERDALERSMKNGQLDPNLAMARLERIPGADPQLGPNIVEGMGRASAYQAMGQQRVDVAKDKAMAVISNAFGSASPIMQAAANNQNPDALYQTIRPLLQSVAKNGGLDQDEVAQMLPDKFDATTAQTVGSIGTSGYDQARIALDTARERREGTNQATEIDLRKQGLQLQMADTKIRAAEADSNINKNNSDFLANKQKFYKKVLGPASNIPWLYGNFMSGKFGSGSSNVPKPGTAYVSPDKTAAAEMDANGHWNIYDITKGTNHAKLVGTLGGGVTGTQPSAGGDFDQQ